MVQGAGDTAVIRELQQINQIACPTTYISMIGSKIVVVSNIHGAKHMANIHIVTVGQIEIFNILQAGNSKHFLNRRRLSICHILDHCHILGKIRILIACHNAPGAGIIAIHAGTDVLNDQRNRILAGIFHNISIGNILQDHQIHHECIKVLDRRRFQHRNFHIGGIAAAGTILVCLPTNTGEGGQLGIILHNIVSQHRNFFPTGQCHTAQGAVGAGSHTGILAQRRLIFAFYRNMRMPVIFCVGISYLNNSRRCFRILRLCGGFCFFRFCIDLCHHRAFICLRIAFGCKCGEWHHRKYHNQHKQSRKTTLCKVFKHLHNLL